MKILYTAEALVTGGREGHGRTSDGILDVQLAVPQEMGGSGGAGTNPEQLFAIGYAACFESALLTVARRAKKEIPNAEVTARVSIGPVAGGAFVLAVELLFKLPGLERAEATALVEQAHQVCPYSNATRNNVPVTLTIEEPAPVG